MQSTFYSWFSPSIDAVFLLLPFTLRWRLLLLQSIISLTLVVHRIPYAFYKSHKILWIPSRDKGRFIRTIVFYPPVSKTTQPALPRPIHVNWHAGGFVGGIAETDAKFASRLAKETGAVVLCAEYRLAPRYPFPAAVDDADDVLAYITAHGKEQFQTDSNLVTVSGFSAGGNLAYAVSVNAPVKIKAIVTFYASIDLRIPAADKKEKNKAKLLKHDPLAFMLPLFDCYASRAPEGSQNDPRLHPILAKVETLPERMLLVVAGIDIIVEDQMTFAKRVKEELEEVQTVEGAMGREMEVLYLENAFHGWLEAPSFILPDERKAALDMAMTWIKETHRRYGWEWTAL
ncbi:alpha/beta-hydrolase [Aulographum hederae CBS 113979]|uniref:Alpha/beta-hydrolase n=1 Tax=Aulographum hederae CBS 113979 TaxID=1176131 RepID=A0A6G1GUL8_9PEZI|nr:alpha/beta-hydrolase [Aulographum hederae CBS 113979]